MPNTTKRNKKTTAEQYKYYVDFLCANDALRNNKNTPENPNAVNEAYEELTMGLNSLGGPEHTPSAWKKVFADWKSQTKKKARLINTSRLRTGGGPSTSALLSEVEERLLATIGRIVVDGAPNIPEAGIELIAIESVEEVPGEINIIEDRNLEDEHDAVQSVKNKTTREKTSEPPKKYKSTTEKVTDAYENAQEGNRKLFSEIISELKDVKESLSGIAQAINFAANVELAKARAKYPNIDIRDINN